MTRLTFASDRATPPTRHPPTAHSGSGVRPRLWAQLPLGLALLTGCASAPDALEASFGQASQCTRLLQAADPLAPWAAWHHRRSGLLPRQDGVNARLGVQHYRERQARSEVPAGVIAREQP